MGRGIFASADRHSSVNAFHVGKGLGDRAPVVISDVSVMPGVISLGANVLPRALRRWKGMAPLVKPTAPEDNSSVVYLSTQSDESISDDC